MIWVDSVKDFLNKFNCFCVTAFLLANVFLTFVSVAFFDFVRYPVLFLLGIVFPSAGLVSTLTTLEGLCLLSELWLGAFPACRCRSIRPCSNVRVLVQRRRFLEHRQPCLRKRVYPQLLAQRHQILHHLFLHLFCYRTTSTHFYLLPFVPGLVAAASCSFSFSLFSVF